MILMIHPIIVPACAAIPGPDLVIKKIRTRQHNIHRIHCGVEMDAIMLIIDMPWLF